ncbi:hypothetical protein H0H93_012976 [Arthromyces matolae]|nr:hypothetical protein H0H93_012976 [Arthromyces matolae]
MNAQRKAKIVAFVKDAEDVRLAIQYAKDVGLPIAIRGGGHNPAGASSVEGGLVIDLSRYLNEAIVDAEKRIVKVGGGALWEAVDKEAIKHGLATVGGTVNHTGVGGLVLGGGYGWLSAEHGLAIDNLVQATVVTADGSILTASESENPDLFFGIRGGGCNFGVVTEFVLKLHPQRKTVYAGHLIFPPPALEKLVELTSKWLEGAGEKEAMMQALTLSLDGKNRHLYHGQGVYMKGLAHRKPHFPSISKAFEYAQSVSGPEFKATVLFEYLPLGKISTVPSAQTAFRRDPTPSILVLGIWQEDTQANTDRGRTVAHELGRIISEGQEGVTSTQVHGYSNYGTSRFQELFLVDWFCSQTRTDAEAVSGERDSVPDKAKAVFADNYPRLQSIKKRYDPENIFNKWFPIAPA